MIDALIACFVEDLRHKLAMNEYDDVDRTGGFEHISVEDGEILLYFTKVIIIYYYMVKFLGSQIPLAHLYHSEPQSRLCNKLNKLTLATFDENGMIQ